MTPEMERTGMRRSLHRAGLYLGLIDATRIDDGLTYRQRVRVNWQRQWRTNWPFWLWFLTVIIVSGLVRWYVTALVAVGLGAVMIVLAAAWQNHRDRQRPAADTPDASLERPPYDQ